MQTHIVTCAPAAAHFASVAPQPNSMSSACAPIARTRAGVREVDRDRHCGAGCAQGLERGEVVGDVDVECRARRRARCGRSSARRSRLGDVARGRTGSVRERERRRGREREHGRAVVAMVGNDDRDRGGAVADDRVERRRERKIGVHDGVAGQAAVDRPRPARGRGRVERTGVVDDVEAAVARPGDDLGRARDDHDGTGAGGVDDAIRPSTARGLRVRVRRARRRVAPCPT